MQVAGTYILQWQNQEEQGEFLSSISSHKAQLMYFYETLPSVHYRYLHDVLCYEKEYMDFFNE